MMFYHAPYDEDFHAPIFTRFLLHSHMSEETGTLSEGSLKKADLTAKDGEDRTSRDISRVLGIHHVRYSSILFPSMSLTFFVTCILLNKATYTDSVNQNALFYRHHWHFVLYSLRFFFCWLTRLTGPLASSQYNSAP